MMLPTHLSLRLAGCLSLVLLFAGCSSSDARARQALTAYQTATASNDVVGARNALLQLVQVKDDVPDYWIELAKVQVTTGDFEQAYYAFSRAYELDRTNVDVLRSVTQLALRAGDIHSAQTHAEELSILAPEDPLPKLVSGWVAVSESHYEQAIAAADAVLANSPYDQWATALKGRALVGLGRENEAIALLTKQIQAQPSDSGSLQLLSRIYQRQEDWTKVFGVAQKLSELAPSDQNNMLLLVRSGFRSGNHARAREASLRLLGRDAAPSLIASVLDIWADYWPSPQRIEDARSLASQAGRLDQKLVYAAFLSRAGSPQDAIRLSSSAAATPISAANAEANAVLADAWMCLGNIGAAKSRLDAVLAFDPGNATALRARAELELRTGHSAAAVVDAEKLVTVDPNSDRDRLLLARSYAAAGNDSWVDRTLWRAFQDIPADEKIYAALQARKSNDPEALHELQEEFDRQRDAKFGQGTV